MAFDIPNPQEAIEYTMENLGVELTESDRKKVKKILEDVVIQGKSPKKAIGLTPQDLENMYCYAYNLFTHGKFLESRLMMEHLLALDPEDSRYAIGCGAAFQQLKDYQMAAGYYLLAYQIDPQDPIPLYYTYECFMRLNEPISALSMLDKIILTIEDKPEHAILKERVQKTIETLVQDIRNSGGGLEEELKKMQNEQIP